MAFIRARSVLLFAFLAAALMAAATAKKKKPVPRKSSPYDPFDASLYGYLEIPKNDSEAARNAVGDPSGMVTMRLNIYKQNGKPVWLDYIVATFDMEGEMPPTATHVHNATEGSNGPKVLDLPCAYQFDESLTAWSCKGVLGKNLAERTATLVSTLDAIRKNPSGFYGNIHTVKYPDGAVRGQFVVTK